MINHKFSLENTFQEILYRIDNWINKGSGWIIELIESQYINSSTYRPLSESSYMKLPVELRSPRKGLINIKNNHQRWFLCFHVRHLNPVKTNTEKNTQNNKGFVNDLDYDGVGFSVREKDFSKIETKNNISINKFCYENRLVFPIYISDQKFENSMDLLFVINENKSHYVYIKDFNRFIFHKTKNKSKKYFCKSCLQCFSIRKVLTEHKKVCLSINGTQSVRFEKGTIKFKSLFKQIQVPFKIYAEFECNLESVKSYEGSYSKRYQDHIPCSLLTSLFVLMINLSSQ